MAVTLIDTEEFERELRKKVYAEVSALMNDRADMYEQDDEDWPCQIRELRMLANAFRTYAEGVGVFSIEALRKRRDEYRDALQQLVDSLDEVDFDLSSSFDATTNAHRVLRPRKVNDAQDST